MSKSLWPRLAGLALCVESHEVERLEADPPWARERVTSLVRLCGDANDGLGEDLAVLAARRFLAD